MVTPRQFDSLLKTNRIDYRKIFKDNHFLSVVSKKPRDINFFVPVRGRSEFLMPIINYTNWAAKKVNSKVRITIIENDTAPLLMDKVLSKDADYVFIPTAISQSQNLFAKSLCYNIGFLKTPKTVWNIFHDLDILPESDYFVKLQSYLSKNPKWVQPYAKKRVLRLSKDYTHRICANPSNPYQLGLHDTFKESVPGSPGGSIVVRAVDFLQIGGYDPELFYGYSPEDSFFWTKLELIYKEIPGCMGSHFAGSATYTDSPPIEVYHMHHENLAHKNPHYERMLDIRSSFWGYQYPERMKIVEEKAKILKDAFDMCRGE
jgi:hypothetical protein